MKNFAGACGTTWLDHNQLDQLPMWIKYSVSGLIERTEKTGIERDFVEMLLALIPRGVSFSTCCAAYNQVQRMAQARREHGFYSYLADGIESGTVKINQVGWEWLHGSSSTETNEML